MNVRTISHCHCSNRICLPGGISLLLMSWQHAFSLAGVPAAGFFQNARWAVYKGSNFGNNCSFPTIESNTKLNGWGLATKVTCTCLGTLLFLRDVPFLILTCMENSTFDAAEEAPLRLSLTLLWGIWAWSKVDLICASTDIFHIFIQGPIYLLFVCFFQSWWLLHLEQNFSISS